MVTRGNGDHIRVETYVAFKGLGCFSISNSSKASSSVSPRNDECSSHYTLSIPSSISNNGVGPTVVQSHAKTTIGCALRLRKKAVVIMDNMIRSS